MNNTKTQQTTAVSEAALSDVLNLLKKEIFLDLNCHHLGTIQSFNPDIQTVSATVNYPKTFFQFNAATNLYDPVQVSYPLLVDMPVIILGGGPCNLTFPIEKGDQCLVLFNDRSIDNWFQSGQVSPLNSPRAHSFSDGIVLVGLNYLMGPSSTKIEDYDTERAVLRNGTTGIGVGEEQVLIYNETNGHLGASLTAFFTALQIFMTACQGSVTDPVLAAAAAAFSAAMMVPVAPTMAGPIVNIEGLLE